LDGRQFHCAGNRDVECLQRLVVREFLLRLASNSSLCLRCTE
jgi:hypothetical protein